MQQPIEAARGRYIIHTHRERENTLFNLIVTPSFLFFLQVRQKKDLMKLLLQMILAMLRDDGKCD